MENFTLADLKEYVEWAEEQGHPDSMPVFAAVDVYNRKAVIQDIYLDEDDNSIYINLKDTEQEDFQIRE